MHGLTFYFKLEGVLNGRIAGLELTLIGGDSHSGHNIITG
jgi:hypothetical protein